MSNLLETYDKLDTVALLIANPDPDLAPPISRNESQDHNLALGSERESIGLNQTEQFTFEYWSYSR